jgi:thiaminase/transcriptional activator TenA
MKVALAPCVIGYAEIAARISPRAGAHPAANRYRIWIDEYAGAAYQQVAEQAQAHLERLAVRYLTPARETELAAIFRNATRLETGFWDMGLRADSRR